MGAALWPHKALGTHHPGDIHQHRSFSGLRVLLCSYPNSNPNLTATKATALSEHHYPGHSGVSSAPPCHPQGLFQGACDTLLGTKSLSGAGLSLGSCGHPTGKPWSPFPLAAGMHVVQSPLVTASQPEPRFSWIRHCRETDVPRARWQQEGEGRPPQCCRRHPRKRGLRVRVTPGTGGCGLGSKPLCQRALTATTQHNAGLARQGWEKLLGSKEGTSGAVCEAGPRSEPRGAAGTRARSLTLQPCDGPFPSSSARCSAVQGGSIPHSSRSDPALSSRTWQVGAPGLWRMDAAWLTASSFNRCMRKCSEKETKHLCLFLFFLPRHQLPHV